MLRVAIYVFSLAVNGLFLQQDLQIRGFIFPDGHEKQC